MGQGVTLISFWTILKKRKFIIFGLTSFILMTSLIVNFYILKPVYEATTTIIVGKKLGISDSVTTDKLLDYNVLLANRQLAKTYEAIARSRSVELEVIRELVLSETLEEFDKLITVSNLKNTEVLEFKVEYNDPVVAANIANKLVEEFSYSIIKIKNIDTVSVVDEAIIPDKPIKPRKLLNLLISFIVGFLSAIGLSLLIEHLDNTMKEAKEVSNVLELPLLGVIPGYKDNVDLENPKSPIVEAFRTLRTNIEFLNVDTEIRKILITSTGASEGKSSVLANLAKSLAQRGNSVLIIDADLRRPTQHKLFNLSNLNGLSTTLISDIPYLANVQQKEDRGLYILTSGPIPPNPVELLGSKRMQSLIEEAGANFDVVLIDSPPIIAMADGLILTRYVDTVIFVVAAGQVTVEHGTAAKEKLERVGAKISGVVLNKVKLSLKEQSYYYY